MNGRFRPVAVIGYGAPDDLRWPKAEVVSGTESQRLPKRARPPEQLNVSFAAQYGVEGLGDPQGLTNFKRP